MVISCQAGRFSSHPGADGARSAGAEPGDLTRATPFARWDADAPLPGLVSQKPGSRFGRQAPSFMIIIIVLFCKCAAHLQCYSPHRGGKCKHHKWRVSRLVASRRELPWFM